MERTRGVGVEAGGRRFGRLVHAILRDAGWESGDTDIRRLAALHARLEGATSGEECDPVIATKSILEHPLLRRAAKAARCHRELPVTFPLLGNRVLEGVIDLAFVENGRWRVIDFKTDEDLGANLPVYEKQLRWYMHALTTVTGIPAAGTLLALASAS